MPQVFYEWQGHEYTHEERGADWYWALGIVATGAALTAILFGDILFGIVIILAALALALQATKRPALHRFALTDRGFQIGSRIFPYENIASFSMIEYIDETIPPAVSLKTTSILFSHLIVPLQGVEPDDVFNFLEQHVPHIPHHPTFADHLASWLRI